MEAQFSGELEIVRRHFPLEANFNNTREASRFAEAAAQQGRFLEYSDLLYENQDDWDGLLDPTPIFEGYAEELRLNLNTLADDLVDPAIDASIDEDAQNGLAVGVSSTPTFVLQGEIQTGLVNFTDLGERIQDEINALDEVFRIDRETGELTVADTNLFASASFPISVPVVVRDTDGNEEVIDVAIERIDI